MIGIIDYGAGNLRSVKRALDFLEVDSCIIQSADQFDGLEKVILPGVGAFQSAVEKLKEQCLFEKTGEWLQAGKPFLGICLGMQVLLESSEESPEVEGFGILKGDVPRFKHHRVPQIGWNQVSFLKSSHILAGLENHAFFYFLHGYYVRPFDGDSVVGATEYGVTYPSIIQQDNIFGVQFHPEKSGKNGLKLLRNWVEL
ncbi:MAG: imidazole glycerol phosphate synthase subunit HisH [bacterium]